MKVDVITPSNGRPETLNLCRLWVERQTYPHIKHIVSDTPGSLTDNLELLLDQVTGDVVVVFEDDDWYHPQWVEYCVKHLENFMMVGEVRTRYYHLPLRKYRDMHTAQRASLCNTAFRPEMIPYLQSAYKIGNAGIDSRFWLSVVRAGIHTHLNEGPFFVVGMKGLPGLKGMGAGHNKRFYTDRDTEDGAMLRRWVGDSDATIYLDLLKEWKSLGKIVCDY